MRLLLKPRRVYVLLFLIILLMIIYISYIKKERRDFIHNDGTEETIDEKGKRNSKQPKYAKTINKIRQKIKMYNTAQKISNIYMGPITNMTYVIVIQCHSNVHHLKRLLNSLKNALFIDSSLLIFSHDYYSYKMNKVIESINFAMYMQIFYPYSLQLHPETFPGEEEKSCMDGLDCVHTNAIKTNLRDAKAAQSKHHWWWQVNQIFEHLYATRDFTDPILFLDAHNYAIIDALYIFRLLVHARNIHCPFCEIISLAAHDPTISRYKKRKTLLTVEAWTTTIPSTAVAFDSKLWHAIKIRKKDFCSYNDTTWDNTLKHLAVDKWGGNIFLTTIDGPRVLGLDECDNKDLACKRHKVQDIRQFTISISNDTFPLSVKLKINISESLYLTEPPSWSDVRDHQLCMQFANKSIWFEN